MTAVMQRHRPLWLRRFAAAGFPVLVNRLTPQESFYYGLNLL